MSPLKFAELFAGAGGMSLGLESAGWSSVWHAEIADAPQAILSHHWPSVPLYGDVTTLDGEALVALHGPINLLCGGSPCQDLSVAGKRAGMTEGSGTRSSLFYEQVRLWNETGADLCLWENVDGARSSNNGKDFGAVLRAFVGAAVPVPSDGWRSAGVAAGPGGVAAWRVLDAQYFGVPQRRRRVFVLGTRTGRVDPAQVLSLAESLRGDTPQSQDAGEGFAGGTDDSLDKPRSVVWWEKQGELRHYSHSHSLMSGTGETGNMLPRVIAFGHQNSAAQSASASASASAKCTPALDRSKVPAVLAFNSKQDGTDADSIAPSLLAMPHEHSHANGGGQLAVCVTGETTHALMSDGSDGSEDGTGRGTPIVVFNETGHEKWSEEPIAGSLNAHEAREAREAHTIVADQDYASIVSPPLVPGDHAGSYNGMDAAAIADAIQRAEVVGTLTSRTSRTSRSVGAQDAALGHQPVTAGIPRRLMPIECERLMGWPDNHTLVPDAKGKLLSDAARYKACGNGVASPVAEWIGERLRIALEAAPATSTVAAPQPPACSPPDPELR